jgi:hypothetical protein
MFTTYHPDQRWLLVRERTDRLLAEAATERSRRAIAFWRPARLRRPTLDLDRLPARDQPREAERAA